MKQPEPEALQRMRERGGQWAVYQNLDLHSNDLGRLVFLQFGPDRTLKTPPKQYPDTADTGLGWRYVYTGRGRHRRRGSVIVTLDQLMNVFRNSIKAVTTEQRQEIRDNMFLPIHPSQWTCSSCRGRQLMFTNSCGLRALCCPEAECDLAEILEWLGSEPILTASDRWFLREVGAGDYNDLDLNLFDHAFLRSIQIATR